MTSDKLYQSIVTMLQEYDLHTGSRGAEAVIAHPERWSEGEVARHYPFYAQAAALLIEAKTRMSVAASSRSILSAAKRFANSDKEHFRGIFEDDGRFCICDGYRFVRFVRDLPSLPRVEQRPIDTGKLVKAAVAEAEGLVPLPTVADLKAFLAADKAKGGKRSPYPLEGGRWWCNPQFLLDMLQALPGCRAWWPKGPLKPMYFEADNGDGLLLPVRPPQQTEQQRRTA